MLPYKGPNGTWRRPIVLECTAGGVKLQPKGLTFTAMDLSPLINPRLSPLVRAIAHEMLHIQASDTPDGAAAVPYLVFLVRPSGIRPYYEARSCLEPLGIAFGYELIEQDLAVDIPDFDNLATWDGSVPLDLPLEPAPRAKVNIAMNAPAEPGNGTATGSRGDEPTTSPGWPESSSRGGQQSAGDPGNAGSDRRPRISSGRPEGGRMRRTTVAARCPAAAPETVVKADGDGLGPDAQGVPGLRVDLSDERRLERAIRRSNAHVSGGISQRNDTGRVGTGRYPLAAPGRASPVATVSASGLSPGGGSVPILPSGNGLSLGVSAGAGPGSSTPAGGGFGPGLAPGGGTGSNPIAGAGGAGSSFASGRR